MDNKNTKFNFKLLVDRAVELLENFNPSERADAINFLLIAVKNKFPETNEILRSVVAELNHNNNKQLLHQNNKQSQSQSTSPTPTQPLLNKNNNNNNNNNQCQQQNFRKILCNEHLVLVDSEEDIGEEDEDDLDLDQGDSDVDDSSPVYSSSVLSVNQRRKGLKRTFLTSTPSSTTTSYKRHFHEGRLLSERLNLGTKHTYLQNNKTAIVGGHCDSPKSSRYPSIQQRITFHPDSDIKIHIKVWNENLASKSFKYQFRTLLNIAFENQNHHRPYLRKIYKNLIRVGGVDGIKPPLSYIIERNRVNRLSSCVPVRKRPVSIIQEMEFIASGRGAPSLMAQNKHNDSPHSLTALELSAKNDESQASHQFDGESYIEELEEFEKAMVVESGNANKNGLTYFNEDEYPMDIEDDYQHQDTNTSLTTESSDDATNTTITNRTNNLLNTIVDNNSTNSITLNSIPDEEPKEEEENNIFSATSGAGSVDLGGIGGVESGIGVSNTSGIGLSSVDPDGDGSSSLSQPPPAKKPKPTYSCLICPKSYRKRKSLIDHYKQHPGYCHDCGQPSGHSLEEIIAHNRSVHSKEFPFVCETCGESYSRRQQFHAHVEAHNKKEFKNETGHRVDGAICEICGTELQSKNALAQHIIREHKKDNFFECHICQNRFTLKANLERHVQLHTEVKRTYVCEQCGSSYFTYLALREHYSNAHTDASECKCTLCGKTFGSVKSLQRHLPSHSEERPHNCCYCPQTFKWKTHLVRHKQTVHANLNKNNKGGVRKTEKINEDSTGPDGLQHPPQMLSPSASTSKPQNKKSNTNSKTKQQLPPMHPQQQSQMQQQQKMIVNTPSPMPTSTIQQPPSNSQQMHMMQNHPTNATGTSATSHISESHSNNPIYNNQSFNTENLLGQQCNPQTQQQSPSPHQHTPQQQQQRRTPNAVDNSMLLRMQHHQQQQQQQQQHHHPQGFGPAGGPETQFHHFDPNTNRYNHIQSHAEHQQLLSQYQQHPHQTPPTQAQVGQHYQSHLQHQPLHQHPHPHAQIQQLRHQQSPQPHQQQTQYPTSTPGAASADWNNLNFNSRTPTPTAAAAAAAHHHQAQAQPPQAPTTPTATTPGATSDTKENKLYFNVNSNDFMGLPNQLVDVGAQHHHQQQQQQPHHHQAVGSIKHELNSDIMSFQNMWPPNHPQHSSFNSSQSEQHNLQQHHHLQHPHHHNPHHQQQQQQQQQQQHHSQNYNNNIGSILTNLELIGNNNPGMEYNFDLVAPPPPIGTQHQQHQQQQHQPNSHPQQTHALSYLNYDYANPNHTLTDISDQKNNFQPYATPPIPTPPPSAASSTGTAVPYDNGTRGGGGGGTVYQQTEDTKPILPPISDYMQHHHPQHQQPASDGSNVYYPSEK
ncbi:hypothetical protein ACFFRR_008361 [Megaselia abdita]